MKAFSAPLRLLPGVEFPPTVAASVLKSKEGATDQVRSKSWKGGQKQELFVGCEVGFRKEPGALVLHQGSSHRPGADDVDSGKNQRPENLFASVNLLCLGTTSHGHRDPGVGDKVEEDSAKIDQLVGVSHLPESSLVLGEPAMEEEDRNPPEGHSE